MANKYKEWDKTMLTFTVPSHIQGKTIKKGRYTKLRYLLRLRGYIAKQINNIPNVKYFMNIELGKAYSNPHLHVQIWSITSADTVQLLFHKAIDKFDLQEKRCSISLPQQETGVYHYVIKDYARDLSDKDIWALETQKKRMRTQLGSKVRFYTKSSDKYSKKVYRIFYYYFNVLRGKANEFIERFVNIFFKFSKRNMPVVGAFGFLVSKLCYIEQECLYEVFFILDVIAFMECMSFFLCVPAVAPPSF